jgi:hypothetical protein
MVYQVRVRPGGTPEDMVRALSRAVWEALRQLEPVRAPEPRLWRRMHRDFLKVFRARTRSFSDCGSLPVCRYSIGVYGERSPAVAPFILALRGGLVDFVQGLSTLVLRRLAREEGWKKSWSGKVRDRLTGAVHRALTPYLYYNDACSRCPARGERR